MEEVEGEILEVEEIINWGKENDARVISDNEHAALIKDSSLPVCDKCDGTGNEFMFMYRKCEQCDGKGYIIGEKK